jgi:hypothetical protein
VYARRRKEIRKKKQNTNAINPIRKFVQNQRCLLWSGSGKQRKEEEKK